MTVPPPCPPAKSQFARVDSTAARRRFRPNARDSTGVRPTDGRTNGSPCGRGQQATPPVASPAASHAPSGVTATAVIVRSAWVSRIRFPVVASQATSRDPLSAIGYPATTNVPSGDMARLGLLSLVAGSGGWLPGAAQLAHKSTSRHIPEDQGKAIARPDDELPSRSIGAERDRTRTAQPGQLKPVELRIPNSRLVGRDSLGVDAPADQQAAAFRVEGHRRGVKAPIVLEESGVHTLEESGRLIAELPPTLSAEASRTTFQPVSNQFPS